MRLAPTGIVRQLGVKRLLQFLYHLPRFLQLFSRLVSDPRVALRSKLVPLGILAYLILPTDFLPDVFLGFGQIDDLVVILLGLRWFLRLCPAEVVQEHVKAVAAGR
ncbi:MAG TPA: DUF1232 domain-containing protein [Candidatus Binatia bacterium]|jgi:uncharacterized membrane protein YkvA (DUF1232 family)